MAFKGIFGKTIDERLSEDVREIAQYSKNSRIGFLAPLPVITHKHAIGDYMYQLASRGDENPIIVQPVKDHAPEGHQTWVCRVIYSEDDRYGVGGYDIVIQTAELMRSKRISIGMQGGQPVAMVKKDPIWTPDPALYADQPE